MTDKLLIDRAVVEQALEAIEALEDLSNWEERILGKICDKLRAALAEQPAEQRSDSEHMEPVAWSVFDKRTKKHWYTHDSQYTAQHYSNEYSHREPDGTPHNVVVPLYTSPPAGTPWVGLTQQEQASVLASVPTVPFEGDWHLALFTAIEAKLKEKNT